MPMSLAEKKRAKAIRDCKRELVKSIQAARRFKRMFIGIREPAKVIPNGFPPHFPDYPCGPIPPIGKRKPPKPITKKQLERVATRLVDQLVYTQRAFNRFSSRQKARR
jgi:hypothetical protein